MDHSVVHSSTMDDAMVQQEHTVEEEHVGDMEGMKNMEEIHNKMTSAEVVVPGSEPVTPRAETHRALTAIDEVGTPSRRSKTRADMADEPSLERAERIKAARNLDFNPKKGTKNTSHVSFLEFSNEHVDDNLSVVGVSLGSNMESIANTVACVREAEIKRLDTISNEDKISSVFDKEEKEELDEEKVDRLILNSLCSEIMDEVMDLGDAYPLDCKITPRNKTSSSLNGCKQSRSKPKQKMV
jgi:hypothetical protein